MFVHHDALRRKPLIGGTPIDLLINMGFGKNNTGVIIREDIDGVPGALVNGAVDVAGGPSLTEDFRLLKSEVTCSIRGLTGPQGEGLLLGIANGELTSAEIAECLSVNGPVDRNDRLAIEKAERFCKIFGATGPNKGDGSTTQTFYGIDGGPLMEVKPRWTFSDPEAWNWFIYNNGLVLTTGSTYQLLITNYGVWVT